MSEGPFALGIDVGTSGVRVAALDPVGDVAAFAAADMGKREDERRDPNAWRAALDSALSQLFAQIPSREIAVVAVDGTSGTVLALDSAGDPIGPALMYNDAVSEAEIPAAIAAAAPRESAAHGASSGLARAIALQKRPGVARIVHQADWIAEQLAGSPVGSDESNALKTGYDPLARCWPDWIDATSMRRELLPPVAAAGARTGETSGAFGLPVGASIVGGCTDGCASFLATGADQLGDGVTALGTTLTIKLLSQRPIFAPEYGVYSHRIGDLWLLGGASNSGGGVLAAYFSPDEIDAMCLKIDPNVESELDYYPLPHTGERFPISDPHFAPRLEPRPDDNVQFLRGMLEGVARIEALGYARLAELGASELKSIRSVGGGAQNETWTAIRKRMLRVSFTSADSTDAAIGVARLALPFVRKSV